jgi:hypothetical protein
LWIDLRSQIDTFEAQGVYREVDPQAALREQAARIAVSVYGYVKRLAAIVSLQDGRDTVTLNEAEARLSALIERVHDPLSWRLDVAAKREQTRLGRLR